MYTFWLFQDNSVSFDLDRVMRKKSDIVQGLTKGIEYLFKKNGVHRLKAEASFISNRELSCRSIDGTESVVTAKEIIIATGSKPISLSGIEIDEETIVSSTGALSLKKVPSNLIIIGAGIIGLELGSVWSRLGSKVTFIEMSGKIGSAMDSNLAY